MRRASGSDMTMWAVGPVFTFIPTVVELVLVCGLLAQKVSGMVAAIVLVTFTAYVAWTVHITTQAAESRKQVNKLENLATGKAVDALLNYETVVQVCPDLLAHGM
jgi:ABC-type transport system involved in Fe-S cluster assembly fused permease/ATPase subunit